MKVKGYEITAIRKNFTKVDLVPISKTASNWEKRKCFMCKRHFIDGDIITLVLTKHGKNLVACEECSKKL